MTRPGPSRRPPRRWRNLLFGFVDVGRSRSQWPSLRSINTMSEAHPGVDHGMQRSVVRLESRNASLSEDSMCEVQHDVVVRVVELQDELRFGLVRFPGDR